MAKDMDATIYLVHVVVMMEAVDAPEAVVVGENKGAEDDARFRLQAMAAEKLARLRSEAITRVVAVRGETSKIVLEVATDLDADLIVLNTHGWHGLAQFIMGSVTEQVVRRASCPVLTLTSTAK